METANIKSQNDNRKFGFPITLTQIAVGMVKEALEEEDLLDNQGLRVAVRGGGCAGLQYVLDFEAEKRIGDYVADFDGLKVYVDLASARFLKGTEVDYVKSPDSAGFKFNNPNPIRTCGCGQSVS